MTNNRLSRRGFLELLGIGVAAPLLPDMPIPLTKDESPVADMMVTALPGNVFIGYPPSDIITGDVLAFTGGIVTRCNYDQRPIGIALNDAENGEEIRILVNGHI